MYDKDREKRRETKAITVSISRIVSEEEYDDNHIFSLSLVRF